MRETYLGDGLYASDDGYQFTLRAPRENGDHFVSLESGVLDEFLDYIARQRNVTINITKNKEETREN